MAMHLLISSYARIKYKCKIQSRASSGTPQTVKRAIDEFIELSGWIGAFELEALMLNLCQDTHAFLFFKNDVTHTMHF